MINYKKYGYNVILEGFIKKNPTDFSMQKAVLLRKGMLDYFLVFNEYMLQDMRAMTGSTKSMEYDIIQLIEPFETSKHKQFIDEIVEQTPGYAESVLREWKLSKLLD